MIRELKLNEYQSFVSKLSQTELIPPFNSEHWVELYQGNLIIYGLFEKNDQLVASFFAVKAKKGPVSMVKTPPYSPSNALLFNNPGKNQVKRASKEKKWLGEIAEFLKNQKNKVVFLAFPPEVVDMQPFLWAGLKVTPQYTYRLNLNQDVAQIEAGMSPERRNDIKRAIKDGVTVQQIEDYNQVEAIIQKTFQRKDKGFDQKFVRKILNDFSNAGNSVAFIASFNDKPCAASFVVHSNGIAYYLLGGYDHKNAHAGAGAYALWSVIQHCKSIGIKVFDFEGSMLPEVERYFRGFGGVLTPYYLVHKGNFITEVGLKLRNPELF